MDVGTLEWWNILGSGHQSSDSTQATAVCPRAILSNLRAVLLQFLEAEEPTSCVVIS